MSLYGIYGSHSVEACPLNNKNNAKIFYDLSKSDITQVMKDCKINKIIAQYHSGLEHTLLWVVDAEDAHLIERFCIEIGLASFHTLKIVPLSTFNEELIPTIKRIHGL